MTNSLVVQNLSFAYGEWPVIKNVNLSVKGGEILGIIGPNGSGKSTLLKLISRVLVPDQGRVFINGEDVSLWSRRRLARTLAVVPQDNKIQFDFTAGEIVDMGRSPYLGRFQAMSSRDRQAVKVAMRATGTTTLAERSVMELSGGERQRVIIARALAQEPQVLLLDEPTASLDINHEVEIFQLLRHLTARRQLVTIAVLHDLNLAAEYVTIFYCYRQGGDCLGTVEEVLTSSNISSVYGLDVAIYENRVTGRPHVQPLPRN